MGKEVYKPQLLKTFKPNTKPKDIRPLQKLVSRRIRVTGTVAKIVKVPKTGKIRVTLTKLNIDQVNKSDMKYIDHLNIFLSESNVNPDLWKDLLNSKIRRKTLTCTAEVRKYHRALDHRGMRTYDYGLDVIKEIEIISKPKINNNHKEKDKGNDKYEYAL